MIAFGDAARREAGYALESLRQVHPELPVLVLGDREVKRSFTMEFKLDDMTNVQRSRFIKTNLVALSPYKQTLYLDADCRILRSVMAGFKALDDGWDVVITPSSNQGADLFWHVGDEERGRTQVEVAHQPVQLQGGVCWFRKSQRVRDLFAAWRDEWERWRDQDQAALVRALHRSPARVWLFGRAFNGGAVVAHQFGRARG